MPAEEGGNQGIRKRTGFLTQIVIAKWIENSVKHVFKLLCSLVKHVIVLDEPVHHVLIVNWEQRTNVDFVPVDLLAQ